VGVTAMHSDEAVSTQSTPAAVFDVEAVRRDFPILQQQVHGKPLVYLDNAATTQKPRRVIDRITRYYETENSNIHRGVHHLSELATKAYEDVRKQASVFIGAAEASEIIFLRGTTEAINLVAQGWGRPRLGLDDEIVVTEMEHHSNIVPWQMLCEQTGAVLRVAPIDDQGDVILEEYEALLSDKTRLVAMPHISNALGTIPPVHQMIAMAKKHGALTLVDGAQAIAHLPVNVAELGCDFYTVSGHKMFAPTGVGFLYGRRALLDEMQPWQGGGDMISTVSFSGTSWNKVPHKFEAGTPDIAGVIGMGEAISYLQALDPKQVMAHEDQLLSVAREKVGAIAGVRLIGTAAHRASILSFIIEGVHPHDIGTILDQAGVAIRAGHHCAQPVMEHFGVPATVRASFALYNTQGEVDALVAALQEVREIFN
jgi:cysteine desulfurase/selenocysteine lyase